MELQLFRVHNSLTQSSTLEVAQSQLRIQALGDQKITYYNFLRNSYRVKNRFNAQ